ncbi:MAG UNVERIFIED_CONTAM: hypothetical protein LVR18_25160 [Planctomycetaceae bacterium]
MTLIGWELMSGGYFAALVLVCVGVLGNVWLVGVTGLLPDRATDILYLRSFRTDIDTAEIRTGLERLLGDQHRVSGIREATATLAGRIAVHVLFSVRVQVFAPKVSLTWRREMSGRDDCGDRWEQYVMFFAVFLVQLRIAGPDA